MTLYLKYRPQTLEELDLKDVRESLIKIVKSENIPHAFLFSGPKGSGKTSAARILAKIVNCENRKKGSYEPCNKCEQCISITKGNNIDVIEMDAASHRGIDDIRVLRDAVKLSPARAKKKVYIIDEAHMLTLEASNALLKTLEEPPSHVIFILATTNPEKLIDTIRSRTVNVIFKKADSGEVVRSLTQVAKGEKLKVGDDALELVAKYSDGSFRDAKKLFEQLVFEGKISKLENIEEFLVKQKLFDTGNFIELLVIKDSKKSLEEIEHAIQKGVGAENILQKVITTLRSALMSKVGLEGKDIKELTKSDIISLIRLFDEALSRTRYSVLEQIPLEIAVVEWGEKFNGKKEEVRSDGDGDKDDIKAGSVQKTEEPDQKKDNLSDNEIGEKTLVNLDSNGCISDATWREILTKVRPINTSTEALLRASKPLSFNGHILTLGVFYSFHKERLEEVLHRRILEEVAESVMQKPIRIECLLTKPPVKVEEKEVVSDTNGDHKNGEAKKELNQVTLTETDDEDIIKVAKEVFEN